MMSWLAREELGLDVPNRPSLQRRLSQRLLLAKHYRLARLRGIVEEVSPQRASTSSTTRTKFARLSRASRSKRLRLRLPCVLPLQSTRRRHAVSST